MEILKVNKENFESKVKNSEKTVLLDFYADWCGPCRMLAPVIDEIAEENDDILVGKVNVDEYSDLAISFGIVSIPTLIVMKNGEAVGKLIGVRPKEEILSLIKK